MATPRPPATVDVRLNEVGDKVDIWWSEVRGRYIIPNISSKLLSAGRVRHGLPDPPAAGPLGHGDGVGGAARPPPLPHPRQSRAVRQLQVHSISYSLIRFYCGSLMMLEQIPEKIRDLIFMQNKTNDPLTSNLGTGYLHLSGSHSLQMPQICRA